AFRRVDTRFRLAIAGEGGHTDDYVRTLHQRAGEDSRIVFMGLQARAAARALLRHAALSVLPSDIEGLPLSLLESVAEATPAVVSDIAPHREILGSESRYDLFFPPRGVDCLTRALERPLCNLEHYRAVAGTTRGRAQVRES